MLVYSYRQHIRNQREDNMVRKSNYLKQEERYKYLPKITPEMLGKINDIMIVDFDRLSTEGKQNLTELWELVEEEFNKMKLSVDRSVWGVDVKTEDDKRF
mgnify:FL=1